MRRIALFVIACLAGWVVFYCAFGHAAIRLVYSGHAGPLNGLISNSDNGPIDYYYVRADIAAIRMFLVGCGVLALGWLLSPHGRATLRAYFAESGTPLSLAVFRVVVFTSLAVSAEPVKTAAFANLSPELLVPPAGLGSALASLQISPSVAYGLAVALQVASLCAALGLFSRFSALIASLLAVVVLGIPQLYGKVNHYHFLVWFPLLLAASPCGDSFSLDRFIRPRPLQPANAYARPLRWSWLLLGCIYFWPGFWKLWCSPDWVTGDAMRMNLWAKWAELDGWLPPLRPDRYPALCRAAGLTAVAFELSFVFLVLFPRTRLIIAVVGLAFHNGTNLLMRISFWELQAVYVSFLPWGRTRAESLPIGPVPAGAVDGVGSVLLALAVASGVTLHEAAWPVACFPTFSFAPPPESRSLVFRAHTPAGWHELDTTPVVERLGSERWTPIVRQGLANPAKLPAVWLAVHQLLPGLEDVDRVAIEAVIRSTDPDRRSDPPLATKRLAEFAVGHPD